MQSSADVRTRVTADEKSYLLLPEIHAPLRGKFARRALTFKYTLKTREFVLVRSLSEDAGYRGFNADFYADTFTHRREKIAVDSSTTESPPGIQSVSFPPKKKNLLKFITFNNGRNLPLDRPEKGGGVYFREYIFFPRIPNSVLSFKRRGHATMSRSYSRNNFAQAKFAQVRAF